MEIDLTKIKSKETKTDTYINFFHKNFQKIYLDLSFQRKGAWELKDRIEFLKSLLLGYNFTPIIVANIKECLAEAQKNNSIEDINYFQNLFNKNYKYVSIDGNNRSTTINMFLKDEIAIDLTYIDKQGKTINLKNLVFSMLPEEIQDILEDIRFSISELNSTSLEDLHQIFISVNKGKALNSQEMRNAKICKTAPFIRNLTEVEYQDFFTKISNESDRLRRKEQELASSLLLIENNQYNITKEELNSIFENKIPDSKTFKSFLNKMEVMSKFFKINDLKILEDFQNSLANSKSFILNLFLLIKNLEENKITISSNKYKDFIKWFIETEYIRDNNTFEMWENKESYYKDWKRYTSSRYLKLREKYILKDFEEAKEEMIDNKIIYIEGRRMFTKQEKFQMYQNQNGIDPTTGKKIPLEDITDHSKYQADHIIPYSKGGLTTIENGQLISTENNLAKSNREEKN